MEEKNDVVRFESEDGSSVEMAIIKEFEYNDKKYAVLMANTGCDCGCEDEECTCEGDCKEDKETETSLCILEVVNIDGKETFKDIDDTTEFEKIVKYAEKTIFE